MSIVDISVKRPVTICMFTFAVLLFGVVSLSRLTVNLLPDLSYPTLTIRTIYPGAAPAEVEQLVSKPIEETIGVVKGVRKVTSTSKAGQSDVVLQFEWGTAMDMASLEVREKLDVLQLPLDIEKPLLLRFNPSLDPIMRLGFGNKATTSDGIDQPSQSANPTTPMHGEMRRLRTYAEEQIKRRLESVNGVASVKVGGGLEHQIQVLINQQRTSQLNIQVSDIVQRLKEENINTSGGRVKDGNQEYLVRTLNQFQSLQDMQNLYITTFEGKHIRLGDIAEIRDAYKQRDSISRFDSFEGVEIAIYKEGDANTVKVANNIQLRLDDIQKSLPANYQLQLVYDQSRFIGNAIDEVKSAAVIGGILAMLILYLFLQNIWSTFIISLSIPVSIIATFNLMYGNDISLNIMSLGGIALAIGLLVDNSIVVLENIDKHKQKQKNMQLAAAMGSKEVSMAIFASTLTTMAVFFPLVFVEGIAGQLFRDQALTVTFALAASLIVALTLIPMLAARESSQEGKAKSTLDLGPTKAKRKPSSKLGWAIYYCAWPIKNLVKLVCYFLPLLIVSLLLILFDLFRKLFSTIFKPVLWLFDICYQSISTIYRPILRLALQARALVILSILAISCSSILLLPRLGIELIPSMSQGEFFVELNLANGAQLTSTDGVLIDLASFTQALAPVARTYSIAGTGSLMNATPSQGGDHWGKLNVVLKPHADQTDKLLVQKQMREFLTRQAGVTAKFGEPALFTFSTPLEIEMSGYDLGMLTVYGNQLAEKMDASNRFVDVKSSLQAGSPELKIHFHHAKLAQLGLNAADVSKLIAAKVGGEIASQYSVQDRKVDILVRTEDSQRDSITDIGQLIVNPGVTPAVPLNAVADIELSIGPSEITRIDQTRSVIVSANLAHGDLGEAAQQAKQYIAALNLPFSMQAKVAGQSEEMQHSFKSLMLALTLAIFLVYLVMASQFESLLHPLLILFTVPLACAGSIYGLSLSGTHVSVVVFIGLIMLAGIVVNNAIVLIDRINQLRAAGLDKTEAIIQAAESRLRPILMTTLTTTLGLLPLAIGVGEGTEMRTPMAVTVIFGLLYASVLTLVFIPTLYSVFDRKRFAPTSQMMPSKGETVYG